ncbi:hypothetical protein M3G03_06385 [Aestuariimicrobium sp. p3-SID1156]|uniref:hypothetical protein n=1 Tax=Aestuariimicrobium sp. p3-SID1156 TaxID=2916038 RepID=UPI00223B5B5B|nr:hypothetical protein [Aestuariimicrobium sp. p3-SID1156]MCT1459168.1 hypothetical protein [Aestuariimicrobium sp. p3-SID1156]
MTDTKMTTLESLIGTWRVEGGAEGTATYEWLPGQHFLLQHVDLTQDGHRIQGLAVIGHLRPFGEGPSADIHSRFYDNSGNTLDYVYGFDGSTLHIWAGEAGSPVVYTGTVSPDGNQIVGEWDYAGQGGYRATMTRVEEGSHR